MASNFAVAAEIRWRKCNGSGAQDRIDYREISAEEHAFLMLSRYGKRAREYALDRMRRAALEGTRHHYAAVAERISEQGIFLYIPKCVEFMAVFLCLNPY